VRGAERGYQIYKVKVDRGRSSKILTPMPKDNVISAKCPVVSSILSEQVTMLRDPE
jgi:hypothetical protein